MKKLALTMVLFMVMTVGALAETLWDSQTFAGPYTNGQIAVSSEITNTSGTHDSMEVVIVYEDITPAQTQGLRAVLQEEISTGVWITIASQFEKINNTDSAATRIIKLQPSFIIDPGVDVFIDLGGADSQRISINEGILPARTRLVILQDAGQLVTSITVSAYYNKFNYRQ